MIANENSLDFATATFGQEMGFNGEAGVDRYPPYQGAAKTWASSGGKCQVTTSQSIPTMSGRRIGLFLLEAGTIIGPSADKLRVARATLEKRIVRKYNIFLRMQHFLVLDHFDPQIHAVYFCPQLYEPDSDGNLIPLEGEEIGQLIAQSLRKGVVEKQPWYDPASKLQRPIIPTDRSI